MVCSRGAHPSNAIDSCMMKLMRLGDRVWCMLAAFFDIRPVVRDMFLSMVSLTRSVALPRNMTLRKITMVWTSSIAPLLIPPETFPVKPIDIFQAEAIDTLQIHSWRHRHLATSALGDIDTLHHRKFSATSTLCTIESSPQHRHFVISKDESCLRSLSTFLRCLP
jgi:hypothetical protein